MVAVLIWTFERMSVDVTLTSSRHHDVDFPAAPLDVETDCASIAVQDNVDAGVADCQIPDG